MALIFVMSSLRFPGVALPRNSDKGIHFVEYAILALLLLFALRRSSTWSPRALALVAWIVAAAYGATDELHQAFVPGRYCSGYDWLADATGAGLAVFMGAKLSKGRSRGTDHPAVSR
ncbi:MAG: VanZ family protein [Deltaproteobacteria bacterium]|nr:VanZ family protein [Deltaproteobacteria bacterium]